MTQLKEASVFQVTIFLLTLFAFVRTAKTSYKTELFGKYCRSVFRCSSTVVLTRSLLSAVIKET